MEFSESSAGLVHYGPGPYGPGPNHYGPHRTRILVRVRLSGPNPDPDLDQK
ncbi:Hypothetical predicted protein [Olea europaea subsp. europaea]|uniref:Uncharacterized protein n=1 Tax=Olea europaea subsp. europaea TaxID=158383 RepID=A0A8S0U2Q6_OLEEU|nr:Hypothetical predicted protein [Olea europaea subsp. europaea]